MMLPIQDLSAIISPSSNLGLTGNQPTDSTSLIPLPTVTVVLPPLRTPLCVCLPFFTCAPTPDPSQQQPKPTAQRRLTQPWHPSLSFNFGFGTYCFSKIGISSITTICEEIQKLCYQNCILRQAAEAQASPKKDKEGKCPHDST